MHEWNWGWHMGWMMIWWVFGGIALIYFVTWLVRSSVGTSDTPERILKERYARGEMDREEYERKLADLRR